MRRSNLLEAFAALVVGALAVGLSALLVRLTGWPEVAGAVIACALCGAVGWLSGWVSSRREGEEHVHGFACRFDCGLDNEGRL